MSYETEVLADSPVGFWWLDEPSGTTAADSSGNGFDGTYINTPHFSVTGPIVGHTGTEFQSPSEESVQIATDPALHVSNGTDPWTLEAWFKGGSGVSDFGGVSILTVAVAGQVDFNLGFWDPPTKGDVPTVGYWNGSSDQFAVSPYAIDDGNWHHLVGVFTGTNLLIYVDGVEKDDYTVTANPASRSTSELRIAKRWDGTDHLYGSVCAVAIYDTALSETRIDAHYAARYDSGGPITVSGVGTISVAGVNPDERTGTFAISGIGSIAITGVPGAGEPVTLTGVAAITAAGTAHRLGTIAVTGIGWTNGAMVYGTSASPWLRSGWAGTTSGAITSDEWTIDLQDHDGTPLTSAATFQAARITWTADGPGSVEVDLRPTDVSDEWSPPGRALFKVGGTPVFAADLLRLSRSGPPADLSYRATGLGLANRLDWRLVRHEYAITDDVAAIVESLLDEAQTQFNGDMGFTMGQVVGNPVTRTRGYCFGVVIGDAIRELASIGRGFDWEVDQDGALNIWVPARGIDTGLTLADTDTQAFDVEFDTSDLVTTVSAIGDPMEPFGPRHTMVRTVGMAATHGRREVAVDVDSVDLEELEDAAEAELKVRSGASLRVHTMWIEGRGPWELGDVWLQDSVDVTVESWFGTTASMRLTEVSVTLDPGVHTYVEHIFEALITDLVDGDPDD